MAKNTPSGAAPARTKADLQQQPATIPDLASNRTIPLVEETLSVRKDKVDQGGFRISKHTESHTEVVDEDLLRSDVQVERRAVGTPIAASDELPVNRYEGDTLVIPVVEEILVTEKRLVLREEVLVTRVDSIHRKPERFTLRKEKVSVERLAPRPDDKP